MAVRLREYQERAVVNLRRAFQYYLRVILSAPTGSGKTEVAMSIIEGVIAKGKRVVFICDLLVLVDQTSQRLAASGIEHAVIQGRRKVNWSSRVFVASAQTLERIPWPIDIDLVIIDEAHTQRAAILEKCLELGVKVIGLTATPFSKGMAKFWQHIVTVTTTNHLLLSNNPDTGQPFLCKVRAYRGVEIDETKLKLDKKGEFSDASIERQTAEIVGAAVPEWVKFCAVHFGSPQQTLVFTRTIKSGEAVCKEFQAAGYNFEQIAAHDNPDERKFKMDRFRRGEITGLVSCHALAKGLDVPAVAVMVDMNPLRKSLSLHIQKLGRIMRPAPGKEYGLVLDHCGNWQGFYAETARFFAHGVDTLDSGKESVVRAPPEFRPRECFRCKMILPKKVDQCPGCGADVRPKSEPLSTAPGRMVQAKGLDGKGEAQKDPWPTIVWMAEDKFSDPVRREKWAKAQFKNLTGRFPGNRRKWRPATEPDRDIAKKVEGQYKNFLIRSRYGKKKQAEEDLTGSPL